MKPFKVPLWVIKNDLQGIYDYHSSYSVAKAERILTEYEYIIKLLKINPFIFRERSNNWRVYPFVNGTYLLYYIERKNFWLVGGIFHARRNPNSINEQLSGRLEAF